MVGWANPLFRCVKLSAMPSQYAGVFVRYRVASCFSDIWYLSVPLAWTFPADRPRVLWSGNSLRCSGTVTADEICGQGVHQTVDCAADGWTC